MKKNIENLQHRENFIKQKKLVKKLIIQNKRKYNNEQFKKTIGEPRIFWQKINTNLYNKEKLKCTKNDIKIKDGAENVLNNLEAANEFNDLFVNIPKNLIAKITAK